MLKSAKSSQKSANIEKTTSIRGLDPDYIPGSQQVGSGLGNSKTLFNTQSDTNVETLYNVLKRSPEVVACETAIVEDIMADLWDFIGSKSAIEQAEKFQINSKFYKILTNALFEVLNTGDAYILKLSVNADQMKSVIVKINEQIVKSLNIEINKEQIYELIEQEGKKPKDLQLLKADGMIIHYDETGKISSYEQVVNHLSRVYKPNDIIHLTLMNIGGGVYGFTPLEAALSDIATLIFAKEFAGSYFENDGMPSWMFNLPESNPKSPEYEQLKAELKELKKQANKYRSLVTTGKIDVQQINKFNKDMEFSKLIMHFTQIILMVFGVPAHRVNLTIDVRQVGGAVNRSYEGYYKKISFMQKIFENDLNADLWNAFKVEMKFKRSYKIDEMREAQIVQILTQSGLITVEEARSMMGLEPEKPKGIEPIRTGDQNMIDFKGDKKAEEGRQNNGNPDIPTDNKTK